MKSFRQVKERVLRREIAAQRAWFFKTIKLLGDEQALHEMTVFLFCGGALKG